MQVINWNDVKDLLKGYRNDKKVLLMWSCSAKKISGQSFQWNDDHPDWGGCLNEDSWLHLHNTRCEILRDEIPKVKNRKTKVKDREKINKTIIDGPDFRDVNKALGEIYMWAINRYHGRIYTCHDDFKKRVTAKVKDDHKMLIMSGLYGLLHPFDLIQDYDIEMRPVAKRWINTLSEIFPQYLKSCGDISAIIGFFGFAVPERRVFIEMCHEAVNQSFKGKIIRIFTQKGHGMGYQLDQAGKLILYTLGYSDANPDPNAEFNYEIL